MGEDIKTIQGGTRTSRGTIRLEQNVKTDAMRGLAEKFANGYVADNERETLRNAGYTFNTISAPGTRVTDIMLNGRRVAKTINGKTKWY